MSDAWWSLVASIPALDNDAMSECDGVVPFGFSLRMTARHLQLPRPDHSHRGHSRLATKLQNAHTIALGRAKAQRSTPAAGSRLSPPYLRPRLPPWKANSQPQHCQERKSLAEQVATLLLVPAADDLRQRTARQRIRRLKVLTQQFQQSRCLQTQRQDSYPCG